MGNRPIIRRQGITGGNIGKVIPSLQGFIKNSDYHIVLVFKVDESKKEIKVEMFDPVMKADFKVACIDKAIDFLQVMKSKICDSKEDTEKLMNEKKVNAEDIKTFLNGKIPDIEKEITFLVDTIKDYFKDIPFDIKILAGNNNMIILITSNDTLAKSRFNKFTFEFWQRYYRQVLKPKLGDFELSIQLR